MASSDAGGGGGSDSGAALLLRPLPAPIGRQLRAIHRLDLQNSRTDGRADIKQRALAWLRQLTQHLRMFKDGVRKAPLLLLLQPFAKRQTSEESATIFRACRKRVSSACLVSTINRISTESEEAIQPLC